MESNISTELYQDSGNIESPEEKLSKESAVEKESNRADLWQASSDYSEEIEPFRDSVTDYQATNIVDLRGILLSESWTTTHNLKAIVIEITESMVTCECLIDDEELIFEKRTFDAEMFGNFKNTLKINHPVWIKLSSKFGSKRIDVMDGEGMFNTSVFEIATDWSEFSDLGLDNPFIPE